MGARIVSVARDERRAGATLRKLETQAPRRGHGVHFADLSLTAETRRAGLAIAQQEPRVDMLINNAGAMFANRRATPEGLEMTFALHHMAYFTLTAALGEKLAASAPARIVSTSSMAHQGVRLDFSDLQSAKRYKAGKPTGAPSSPTSCSPANSPAGSPEPASRPTAPPASATLRAAGRACCCLSRHPSSARLSKAPIRSSISPPRPTSPNVTGEYFAKRKAVEPSPAALDNSAAKSLREASEVLAGAWPERGQS